LNTHEATLNALVSVGASKEDCTKARVEMIKVKQALVKTQIGLRECLSAKKEIQAKIDQAMKLGEVAQAGLERCLKNKEQLKMKIKMCHDKRDEAREKLKACLDRKKVLAKQIEACHVKRDEARKKLQECLSRKKVLNQKIAGLKKKGVSVSLVQKEVADAADDVNQALDEVRSQNQLLAQATDLNTEADKGYDASLTDMQSTTDEMNAIVDSQTSDDDLEEEASAASENCANALKGVIVTLTEAGAANNGALAETKANADAVLLLETSLSKLMQ